MASVHGGPSINIHSSEGERRFRLFQASFVITLALLFSTALDSNDNSNSKDANNNLSANEDDFHFNITTILSWLPYQIIKASNLQHQDAQDPSLQQPSTTTSTIISSSSTTFALLNYLDDKIIQYVQQNIYVISCCVGLFILTTLINITISTTFRRLGDSEFAILMKAMHDYLLKKEIFVLSIIGFEMRKIVTWANWYLALSLLLATTQYYKMRLEYLISASIMRRSTLVNIGFRIGCLLGLSIFILLSVVTFGLASKSLFRPVAIFLLADTLYIVIYSLATTLKFAIFLFELCYPWVWDKKNAALYYTDLTFQLAMLTFDFSHAVYLFWIHPANKIVRLVCVIRAFILSRELLRRYKRHQNYLQVSNLMESTFPKASQEDLSNNKDDCAICWDPLKSARKLPCNHLFHDSCIRAWIEQETSCPICRRKLQIGVPVESNTNISNSIINRAGESQNLHWTWRIWDDLYFPSSLIRVNHLRSTRQLSTQILHHLQLLHTRTGARVYFGHESGVRIVQWPVEYINPEML